MTKKIVLLLLTLFYSCGEDADLDQTPPRIIIISPQDGNTISETILIRCISTDDYGIDKLELFVDGLYSMTTYESEESSITWNMMSDDGSYSIISTKPYELTWDISSFGDGAYTIVIRSYDTNGNIAESQPLTLNLAKNVELWGQVYSVQNTTTLSLNDDQLTGTIPAEIGELTNLTQLYLNGNELTGPIPSEIGNLTNLTHLYLHDNELTGPIPQEIGNLTNLVGLLLYDNQFSGSIPLELGNLEYLETLYLNGNELTGLIPDSLCDLIDNNCFVFIYDNQLCPPYPACIENYVLYQDTANCP